MAPDGSIWFQMVPDGSRWFQMVPDNTFLETHCKLALALDSSSSSSWPPCWVLVSFHFRLQISSFSLLKFTPSGSFFGDLGSFRLELPR
eukprot:1315344-Amorphochlora_amoeboformis.AAC.1